MAGLFDDLKTLDWVAPFGTPPQTDSLASPLATFLGAPPPAPPPNDYLGLLNTPPPPTNALAAFGSLGPAPSSPNWLDGLVTRPVPAPTKRKAFFSFHFDDIMRVNVVRNAWKIDHPDNALMRSFYDSSLWERRKIEGDASIKRLIREGVSYTSAVCALVGSDTWLRRWVRYEIARAIIDGRGLLAVHLNSIRHHQTKTPQVRGSNPLEYMAVGKVQADVWSPSRYYLFEKIGARNFSGELQWLWVRYQDHTDPVKQPCWLPDPAPDHVMPLSWHTSEYDYIVNEGHKNIGTWIDLAARRAGR